MNVYYQLKGEERKPVKPVILGLYQSSNGEVEVGAYDEDGRRLSHLLTFQVDGTIHRVGSVDPALGLPLGGSDKVVVD